MYKTGGRRDLAAPAADPADAGAHQPRDPRQDEAQGKMMYVYIVYMIHGGDQLQ